MLYYKVKLYKNKNIGGIILRKYSKFLALVLCMALVLPFTGCGGPGSKDDSSSPDSTGSGKTDGKDDDGKEDKDDAKEANVLSWDGVDFSKYVEIGDYSEIELSTDEIDKETDEMVAANIEKSGDCDKIKKGTVKKGDTINIFYVGKTGGKEFDGGSCTKETNPDGYNLKIGSGAFIDGFEDALVGKKIGNNYDIDVTFPDSYPQNRELEGKPAVFSVTINYKVSWPELSDKFVEKNFKDFEDGYKNTAADYRKYIRKNVIMDQAWDFIYKSSIVKDYPEGMLDMVIEQYRTPVLYYLEKSGVKLDDYLEQQNMSSEDFEKNVKSSAESDLSKRMVFYAIADKEKIEITDDQFKEVLDQYLSEYSVEDQDALDDLFAEYFKTKSDDIINNEIMYDNVKKFLWEKVKETE